MNEINNFLVMISGLMLIYAATDVQRPNDKIKIFSWAWLLQFLLITVGGLFLFSAGKLS